MAPDYYVDDWLVSPATSTISRGDDRIIVKRKSVSVLSCLARSPGEIVTRDEIMEQVWPRVAVTDDVLTQSIVELRKAFSDDAKHPVFVETIPRVGFRLLVAVKPVPRRSPGVPVSLKQSVGAAAIVLVVSAIAWIVIASKDVTAPAGEKSIAVLPFVNRSNIAEDAFFVDGMHDDLLTLLSRLSSVETVISRTSIEQYRGTTKPISQIGQELGVASILEGAVQRSGDQVRINVQLIDTETEQNLWANTFDRDLTAENLFAIQSEITREIITALHGVLSEQENKALQFMPTNNLDAYAEFVLGRHELAKRTGAAILRAQTHFENAIELDTNYALAYVSLADSYILMREYQGAKLEDIVAPMQAAIDEALSIDPLLGEAYTSLAGLRQGQLRFEESERYYLRAIELSPGYATAYHWYYSLLAENDRNEEALAQITRAVELDPLAPVVTNHLAEMYWRLGRHQEAKSTLLDGLERNPDFPAYYATTSWLLFDEGRLGESLKYARTAIKLNPSNPWHWSLECDGYLDLGDDLAAARCYAGMENRNPHAAFSYVARFYCSRSQFEEALDLLRRWEQRAQGKFRRVLRTLAWSYVACGDSGSARSILEDIEPDLFGNGDIAIAPNEMFSVYATVAAAYSLYVDDEKDRANYLFDQALDAMQSMRRTLNYGYGVLDVFIHVTRGDRELAILALRAAVESGWRSAWWELRFPHYASMQDNPEWIELMAEIEADIRQQRQWFEEHKNDPLF